MRSDRLYLAIALVALLVLGAGSASLFSLRPNAGTVLPAPTRTAVSATATVVSLLVPTSPPQSSLTSVAVEVASPVADPAPTEVIALDVVPSTPAPVTVVAQQPTAAIGENVQPQSLATPIPIPAAAPERVGGPVTEPNNRPGPRWVTLQ